MYVVIQRRVPLRWVELKAWPRRGLQQQKQLLVVGRRLETKMTVLSKTVMKRTLHLQQRNRNCLMKVHPVASYSNIAIP